jgi:hypothetical protein
VQGDLSAVLAEVDAVVSKEGAGAKDIADAAMALAFLQARGDRRCVGLMRGLVGGGRICGAESAMAAVHSSVKGGCGSKGHCRRSYGTSFPAGSWRPQVCGLMS